MEELDNLKTRRKTVKSKLTRLFNYVDCYDGKDSYITEIKVRVTSVHECFREFEIIQEKIDAYADSDEAITREEEIRAEFEKKYYSLAAMIETILNPLPTGGNNSSESSSPPIQSSVNSNYQPSSMVTGPVLPPINLPKFSGNYADYVNFIERFERTVGSKSSLSNSDKLVYLKGCVEADAADTLNSLSISDVNYKVALQLLDKRYKNMRLIVAEHVENILGSPCLIRNSHDSVRRLTNDLSVNIEALRSLNVEVSTWDALLIPIITKKLDFQAKREWEINLGVEVPKISDLLLFLDKRFNTLHSLSRVDNYGNRKLQSKTHLNMTAAKRNVKENCLSCHSSEHNVVYKCPVFLSLDVAQRIKNCKLLNLCIKCLFPAKHTIEKCRFIGCKKCKGNHNILLHQDDLAIMTDRPIINELGVAESTSLCTKNNLFPNIMLSTAVVQVLDKDGIKRDLRCLLDSGSQSCFLSEKAQKLLNLPITPIKFQVSSINQGLTSITKAVKIQVFSKDAKFTSNVVCLVVKQITGHLPDERICFSIPAGIPLADPNYGHPAEIDLLVGAELFWQILRPGALQLGKGLPTLKNTAFGFIIGGPTSTTAIRNCSFFVQSSKTSQDKELEGQISKIFYSGLEEDNVVKKRPCALYDSNFCEEQFQKTVRRDIEGRFIVTLPFKECRPILGSSRGMAEKRFLSLERKLETNSELHYNYSQVIQNYLDLGHLIEIQESIDEAKEVYYLPHRAVLKSSKTSSTRVVFDASAKSSNGVSLNDVLHTGPALQQDLFCVLARFRLHQYAITADLTQMYRQIWLDEQNWNYQRVLWRNSKEEKIKTYCLTRVSFGLSCSPFLAIRCLRQTAFENKDSFPLASSIILNDMYIDDLLTGTDTVKEAIAVKDQIMTVLKQAQFHLHKWCSNEPSILKGLNNISSDSLVTLNWEENQKTLGLIWNAAEDCFKFNPKTEVPDRITKRNVSSILGMFFDPLGLLSVVTVTAKVLLQRLWSLKLDWDEEVPDRLQKEFQVFLKGLKSCNQIRIPRKVIPTYPYKQIELHTFSDAAETAYGCCLYIRILDMDGNIHNNLLCSKSRVAPLKTISIPRLELCAAVLGANIANKVASSLSLEFSRQYYWCDSKVVLSWIARPYYKWPTFVANRVKQIQELTSGGTWNYVNSKCNPADLVSRGAPVNRLMNLTVWWKGPAFLQKEELPFDVRDEQIPMENVVCSTSALSLVERQLYAEWWNGIFQRSSTFIKITRIVAYILRFVSRLKIKVSITNTKLTTSELEKAENTIFKTIQQIEFLKEIKDLEKTGSVSVTSKLISLKPFVDKDGLLRVGGRLTNAPEMSYDSKHPIIVPHNHHVTKVIIVKEHQRMLHAGPQATLYAVRQKYWVPRGRSAVKSAINRCVTCFRGQPSTNPPLMGDLPRVRLEYVKPFFSCGIDFAGPFLLRLGGPRSKKYSKAYLCLFICLTTKAVHLELTSDLTTKAFLNTFRRFMARRGQVKHIYSDNAKTFVGADKEMSNWFKSNSFQEVENSLIGQEVTWHFIPPQAPHFGGIWERAVRSVKTHLKRVLGKTPLNFEEFFTVLVLVENCLNSRPLTPISDDPNDLLPLSPNHFLFGERSVTLPEEDFTSTPAVQLKRYQLVQRLRQDVWKRWQLEYFNNLQQRYKWSKNNKYHNLELGALVLIKTDGLSPAQWLTGRVTEVFPGKDGVVRVACVKTASGVLKRPVSKLCPLPI